MTGAAAVTRPAARRPIPMGVVAETGETRPEFTDNSLHLIAPAPAAALARDANQPDLDTDAGVTDPMDLTQTGWCAVFAADADPTIKASLKPLLDLRASQVNDNTLFRIFEGSQGVRKGQSADSWAMTKGIGLNAPVNPQDGVPYYMLLVGSPTEISFEFQAELGMQWAVGRLYFDDLSDYAAYAQKVVAYETSGTVARNRRAAIWMPRNAEDVATPLLAGAIQSNFLGQEPGATVLGLKQKFELCPFIGADATKDCLSHLFSTHMDGGAPSLYFTGSHGAEWSMQDAAVQRQRQGALVTQEWTRGQPLTPNSYFSGADLPADADLQGSIAFMFACFGGGCPQNDSYLFTDQGQPVALSPEPMISALPQKLLSRGMLAIIAHVDRAFSYAFENVQGTPQTQLLRDPVELLMQGKRVGLAADPLSKTWGSLAAQLGVILGGLRPGPPQPQPPGVADLYIARDDARNYLVLGDPAVRLRTDAMSQVPAAGANASPARATQ